MRRIGLISDTHGLLRPEAIAALQGCDHIVHAGDIGHADILASLREIAPLTAIRGNNDTGPWAQNLQESETLEVGTLQLYVIHDLADLQLDPSASGIHVVIAGHSHRPSMQWRNDVLYINPGSAGPRRFSLPVSVGILHIDGNRIEPQLIELQVAAAKPTRRSTPYSRNASSGSL